MRSSSFRIAFAVIGVLILRAPLQAQASGGWDVTVGGYGFFGTLNGSTEIGQVPAPIGLDLDDVLRNRQFGFVGHLEVWNGDLGVVVDASILALSGKQATPRNGVLTRDVEETFVDALLGWRADDWTEVYAGVRYWNADLDLDLSGPISGALEGGDSWVDPVLGVRITRASEGGWFLRVQSDLGGFGVGSKLTWNLVGGVGYDVSDRFSVIGRYKGLWVNYESGTEGSADHFKYETRTHGPLIGFQLHF